MAPQWWYPRPRRRFPAWVAWVGSSLGIAVLTAAISGGVSFGVAGYQNHQTIKQTLEAQQIAAVGELEKSAIPVVKDGLSWYFSHQCGAKSCPPYKAPNPVSVAIDEDRLEAAASVVTNVTVYNDTVSLIFDAEGILTAKAFRPGLYRRLNKALATLFKKCGAIIARGK
jgi:hypothetical protein